MASPFRFGIVGCGVIAPTHIGAIGQIEGTEVVALADTLIEKARALGTKHGIDSLYSSCTELLRNPAVDGVSICTPSGTHADLAIEALRAGKHVIIEKPMDISMEACDRLIRAADECKKVVAVISQHRFDAGTIAARDALHEGKPGRLVLADASVKWYRTQDYYDSGDWRGTWALDGGGALMNQGVHTVDLLQWLAGNVKSVYALTRTAAHERIEVEDLVVAALEFENGAIGTITASTACYPGHAVRLDLYGTEGSIVIEADRLKSMHFKSGEKIEGEAAIEHALKVAQGGTSAVKDDTTAAAATASDPAAVWGDSHRAQIEDFLKAVHTGSTPVVDAREGRKPVAVILAIYRSAKEGRRIDLSEMSE